MARERATVAHRGDQVAVEVPRRMGQAWRDGAELSFTALGPDAALLLRAGPSPAGLLAATLSTFSVADAFGFVISGVRTGRLQITRGASRRTVAFRDGQVVFAHSTERWERLGAALVRLGLIDEAELAQALSEVRPGVRLGQVLTRRGSVSHAQLYGAMTHLVREIVVDAFAESDGEVLFLEGLSAGEDAVKLPEATRELALQGLRRADAVLRLRARLPKTLELAQGTSDPSSGHELWARAAAGASLGELRDGFEGSEHAFLSTVRSLLDEGALVARPGEEPRPPPSADAPSALERYRALIRRVSEALTRAGLGLEALRSFLADPLPGMEAAFAGVTLSEEGDLDVERVHTNLGEGAAARARGLEALDGFVAYALFSARNVLPPDEADALSALLRRAREEAP